MLVQIFFYWQDSVGTVNQGEMSIQTSMQWEQEEGEKGRTDNLNLQV